MAGITYNYLPFMILPLYASLERIDARMLEAGYDLYGRRRDVFLRVTLPLSMPGVVAGTLLTFIPAAGDFINAELLGTPQQFMIGNVIQSRYLEVADYPTAAALSFLLMAFMLIIVLIWARIAGTEALLGTEGERAMTLRRRALDWLLNAYAGLALIYLLVPIAIIIVFSFNNPVGRFNFIWQEFSLDAWSDPFARARHRRRAPRTRSRSPRSRRSAPRSSARSPRSRSCATSSSGRAPINFFIFIPLATPEVVLGAALLSLFLNCGTPQLGFATILIAHIMFNLSFVVITVRSRLIGFDRSLEEAAQDLGATPWETFRLVTLPLIMPGVVSRGAARVRALDRRLRDHVLQLRLDDHVPAVHLGRRARGDPAADLRDRDDDLPVHGGDDDPHRVAAAAGREDGGRAARRAGAEPAQSSSHRRERSRS